MGLIAILEYFNHLYCPFYQGSYLNAVISMAAFVIDEVLLWMYFCVISLLMNFVAPGIP